MSAFGTISDRPATDGAHLHGRRDGETADRPVLAQAGRILRAGFVSLFIAYHVTILLVYNLPSTGPTRGLHWVFNRYALMRPYLEATGNRQGWEFFGPDPPRASVYMRVLVEDRNGGETDMRHDTHGRQRYPYLRHDYIRKVNNRLSKERDYLPAYAAWVCRVWEQTHAGQPALNVRFVRLSTPTPSPSVARATMGYDPATQRVDETTAGAFACADLPNGQLPPNLRRRFGLPAVPEGTFKKAELHTWWDERERGASRRAPPSGGSSNELMLPR